jgi:two-component system cell cycle sensor histidine kinase/response regulator CckA
MVPCWGMWLDVVLFATGAFAGTPHYLNIMVGTLLSRLVISVLAFPFLYVYLNWQNRRMGAVIESRPILAILREVTEVRAELDVARQEIERRKRAEQALRDSEERYRLVMETASDMIILHSLDGRIAYANRAALEASGYSRAEALQLTLFDIVPPDLVASVKDRLTKRQERCPDILLYESAFVDGKGQRVPIEVSSSLVTRAGKPAEVLIMARDIRERRRVESERDRLRSQLLEAQKMEAVGQLAGGIAHDFNNLLTTINGYAELIQRQSQADAAASNMAGKILNAGERAAGLVRQLLGFARQQRIQPQVVDLNAVIHQGGKLKMDCVTAGIQVTANLQPDLWPLHIDLGQVDQLVDGLLCHVCDAIPDGGQGVIQTRFC